MNALMREKSEVAVTGNESIERSIASLREKMDRDHALLAANQATLSERVHQIQSTLSEKIHTVDIVLRDRIDAFSKDLGARIEAVSKSLSERIDAFGKDLSAKIDAANAKTDAVSKSLGERIDTLSGKVDKNTVAIASLSGMLKTMVWVLGSAGTAAAIVNIGKAFHWF
jgi:chromosome segregation ATPase